ncbi:methyltransferase domain-containing protein [Streptomyces sp. NPDC001922]|uniref:methyltransferase domain-containing protein n=1 Tax=Streptomyces sp. NPDC001922 TaxID=3364624 RepID=UPI0036997051
MAAVVDALPLEPHMKVLEIGCGPGAAARAIAARLTSGSILAIDRSATAVTQAETADAQEIAAGRLRVRQAALEDFIPRPDERPFELAFADVGRLREPRRQTRCGEGVAAARC